MRNLFLLKPPLFLLLQAKILFHFLRLEQTAKNFSDYASSRCLTGVFQVSCNFLNRQALTSSPFLLVPVPDASSLSCFLGLSLFSASLDLLLSHLCPLPVSAVSYQALALPAVMLESHQQYWRSSILMGLPTGAFWLFFSPNFYRASTAKSSSNWQILL